MSAIFIIIFGLLIKETKLISLKSMKGESLAIFVSLGAGLIGALFGYLADMNPVVWFLIGTIAVWILIHMNN